MLSLSVVHLWAMGSFGGAQVCQNAKGAVGRVSNEADCQGERERGE